MAAPSEKKRSVLFICLACRREAKLKWVLPHWGYALSLKSSLNFIEKPLPTSNICRSTTAEAILQHLVAEKGESDKWVIDSAATADYNIGRPPDKRTMACLERNGLKGYKHKARLLTPEDYKKFDVIFGMDEANMQDLEEMKPGKSCRARLEMLGDWDPQKERIIEDPYWSQGTKVPFDKVYEQCMRCLTAFVNASN